MRPGDLPCNSQPESCSLNTVGKGIMGSDKFVKDFGFKAFRHTKAAIANGEESASILAPQFHVDFFMFGGILFSIGKQIQENLGKAIRITLDPDWFRRKLSSESEPVCFQIWPVRFKDSLDDP